MSGFEGAVIECGVVLSDTGDGRYIVRSETNYPAETPPIGCMNELELTAGDRVYFFMFEDGNGKILGKM